MIPIPVGPDDDNVPDESPEALQEVALRLQSSISDVFSSKPDPTVTTVTKLELWSRRRSDSGEVETANSDRRLYLRSLEGWQVRVKAGPPEYCTRRNPGQDWFHQLIDGELFVEYDNEKLCLNCAMRLGILTDDRQFWQRGARRTPFVPIVDDADDSDDSVPHRSQNTED